MLGGFTRSWHNQEQAFSTRVKEREVDVCAKVFTRVQPITRAGYASRIAIGEILKKQLNV